MIFKESSSLIKKNRPMHKRVKFFFMNSYFQDVSEYLNTIHITLEYQRSEVVIAIKYMVYSYLSRWLIFSSCIYLVLPFSLRTTSELGISLPMVFQVQYDKKAYETCNATVIHGVANKLQCLMCYIHTRRQTHALRPLCLNSR